MQIQQIQKRAQSRFIRRRIICLPYVVQNCKTIRVKQNFRQVGGMFIGTVSTFVLRKATEQNNQPPLSRLEPETSEYDAGQLISETQKYRQSRTCVIITFWKFWSQFGI